VRRRSLRPYRCQLVAKQVRLRSESETFGRPLGSRTREPNAFPLRNARVDRQAPGKPDAIGVVVIHGVMPRPRYGIQDLAARNLCLALEKDAHWSACGGWTSRVTNLKDPDVVQTLIPDPTISRVQVGDDEAPPLPTPFFDVIESYWSRLDKGKTTFASVSSWILQTLFVPLNTTARYAAPAVKTCYDFGLVVGGIALVVALLVGAFICATT